MHRPAERRVTYFWLTIALALIAGLAITLTTQSQAKTRTRTATAARPTVVLSTERGRTVPPGVV